MESPLERATAVAIERLLKAWRGEIEAEAVYSVLAARQSDSKQTAVLERMAAAEVTHRHRIEHRLSELGVAPPDPAKFGISPWLRLQARLAPRDRLLARMETNEQEEINDRYERPTGDALTDQLLHSIRSEEQTHSRQVRGLRASGEQTPPAASQALQRILGREKWHRTGSGWISGAIYGANDGLAAVFGIVAGVSGATGGSSFVLTAGLFGAIASALSMATDAFLAERSTSEVALANIEGERRGLIEHPKEEQEEVSLFYQLKGLSKTEADQLAERLAQNQESMLNVLAAEELGGSTAERTSPAQSAVAAGGRDRRSGVAIGALPGRRGQVALHPSELVVGWTGDDGCRGDSWRHHVHGWTLRPLIRRVRQLPPALSPSPN